MLAYGFVDVLVYRCVPPRIEIKKRKPRVPGEDEDTPMMVSELGTVEHPRESLADVLAFRAFGSLEFCLAIRTACCLYGVVCTEVYWVFVTFVFA